MTRKRPAPPKRLPDPNEPQTPMEPSDGNGNPEPPLGWNARWRRAMGPNPDDGKPEFNPPPRIRAAPNRWVDMRRLRWEEVEPPRAQLMPPEFAGMREQLEGYLRGSRPPAHPTILDLQNCYWVSVASADPEEGTRGLLISMPADQVPGPGDRILVRRPWDHLPYRWVEVSRVGAFRLDPDLAYLAVEPANQEGVAYLGTLAF